MSFHTTINVSARLLTAAALKNYPSTLRFINFRCWVISKSFTTTQNNTFKLIYPVLPPKKKKGRSFDFNENLDTNSGIETEIKEKPQRRSRFTEEEDSMILDYVERFGNNLETFIALATELNRKYHKNIRYRYYKLIRAPVESKLDLRRRRQRFSKEEDAFILNYVKQKGENIIVFKLIADHLRCKYWTCIKKRHELITSPKASISLELHIERKKPRAWTIDDDTQLITFLLEVCTFDEIQS